MLHFVVIITALLTGVQAFSEISTLADHSAIRIKRHPQENTKDFLRQHGIGSLVINTDLIELDAPTNVLRNSITSVDLADQPSVNRFWMDQVKRIGREIEYLKKNVPGFQEELNEGGGITLSITTSPASNMHEISFPVFLNSFVLRHELCHHANLSFIRYARDNLQKTLKEQGIRKTSLDFGLLDEALCDTMALVNTRRFKVPVRQPVEGHYLTEEHLGWRAILMEDLKLLRHLRDKETVAEVERVLRKENPRIRFDTKSLFKYGFAHVINSFLYEFSKLSHYKGNIYSDWLNHVYRLAITPQVYHRPVKEAQVHVYPSIDKLLNQFALSLDSANEKAVFVKLREQYNLTENNLNRIERKFYGTNHIEPLISSAIAK